MSLLTGNFERGWAEKEYRRKRPDLFRQDFSQPLWLGDAPLEGKTILLHSEQGFGDTIQFCRYVPMVAAAAGARVIFDVEPPLERLMCSSLSDVSEIIFRGDPLPAFDMHCPLLSLPLAFGTRLETIPAASPYLRAPAGPDREPVFGPKGRPRIGVAWSGNPGHGDDHNRSIALEVMLPLFDFDATFVSLQKRVRDTDKAALERSPVVDIMRSLLDFSDTAELISELDLVITVDTSIAHLAGALGKPVWILLPFIPDWRWLLDREDSPWYPTARLFRQSESSEWRGVIMRVRQAMECLRAPAAVN
jgi:hypothetical protein